MHTHTPYNNHSSLIYKLKSDDKFSLLVTLWNRKKIDVHVRRLICGTIWNHFMYCIRSTSSDRTSAPLLRASLHRICQPHTHYVSTQNNERLFWLPHSAASSFAIAMKKRKHTNINSLIDDVVLWNNVHSASYSNDRVCEGWWSFMCRHSFPTLMLSGIFCVLRLLNINFEIMKILQPITKWNNFISKIQKVEHFNSRCDTTLD